MPSRYEDWSGKGNDSRYGSEGGGGIRRHMGLSMTETVTIHNVLLQTIQAFYFRTYLLLRDGFHRWRQLKDNAESHIASWYALSTKYALDETIDT